MNTIKVLLRNRKFFPLRLCVKGRQRIINTLREDLND